MITRKCSFLRTACLSLLIAMCCVSGPKMFAEQPCSVIEKALRAAENLKKGMLRSEVEKQFVLDGGASFRDETIYTYRDCPYLKVKIRFNRMQDKRPDSMDADTVESASNLYVEWPHGD